MRLFSLFLSLLCVLTLTACGTEEEITPPAFSNIKVNDADISSIPYTASNVIITGNIDDFTATIVANSTATGEVSVAVDSSDGSWSFPFTLQAGVNVVSFIASDQRGNLNQLILNLIYEPAITE
jgi:predicted small lipoprotein YifL